MTEHANGGGGHGPDVGKMWGIAILIIVLVILNILGMLSGQLNSFFQVVKLNTGAIFVIVAIVALWRATKK